MLNPRPLLKRNNGTTLKHFNEKISVLVLHSDCRTLLLILAQRILQNSKTVSLSEHESEEVN